MRREAAQSEGRKRGAGTAIALPLQPHSLDNSPSIEHRGVMGIDAQTARIRAQAMNDLRDIFRRDGNAEAAMICGNASALEQVGAGLTTFEEIQRRGSTDL